MFVHSHTYRNQCKTGTWEDGTYKVNLEVALELDEENIPRELQSLVLDSFKQGCILVCHENHLCLHADWLGVEGKRTRDKLNGNINITYDEIVKSATEEAEEAIDRGAIDQLRDEMKTVNAIIEMGEKLKQWKTVNNLEGL